MDGVKNFFDILRIFYTFVPDIVWALFAILISFRFGSYIIHLIGDTER